MAESGLPPPTSTAARTLAGRYRLDRCLAIGGMAEVWVATDQVLDRPVAVKLLKPSMAGDAKLVERFRREAVAAARLSHPSIVSVFDTVSDDGSEAVVMELVNGPTLRQVLDSEGRLSVATTIQIGLSLADALTVAHRARIVHRDLKPANVLMSPDGRILLTDFGIAKALQETNDLTSDNVMMGTAKYLSPEQVLGVPLDGRSDLYSLGVVLYECLTGQVPFKAESDAATAMARLSRDPVPVRSLRPGVPRALEDLVMRLLSRNADDRPRNAVLVRDALTRLDGTPVDDATVIVHRDSTPSFGTPTGAVPPTGTGEPTPADYPQPPMHHRRWLASVLVICLVAAILAGAGTVLSQTDAGARPIRSVKDKVTGKTETTDSPATTAVATATATVAAVGEFDPPPAGDGKENPDQVGALIDNNPSTLWSTVCYGDRDMAPKQGVGLVFQLSGPAAGHTLTVSSPTTGGWAADVFVADKPANTLNGWGDIVTSVTDRQPGDTALKLGDASGTYVLVFLRELGNGAPGCTKYPYQMRISGVRLS